MKLFLQNILAVPKEWPSRRLHYEGTLSRSAVRCFLFWMVAGALGFSPEAFADTTWVSGPVSGTWTREGSPYVIEDSTWVLSMNELHVQPGVHILLPDSSSQFFLVGRCDFVGTESDSIIIETGHAWATLRGYPPNPAPLLWFRFVSGSGEGGISLESDTLVMNHCSFDYISNAGELATVDSCLFNSFNFLGDSIVINDSRVNTSLSVNDADIIIHGLLGISEGARLSATQIFGGTRQMDFQNMRLPSLYIDVEYNPNCPITFERCNITNTLTLDGPHRSPTFSETRIARVDLRSYDGELSNLVIEGGCRIRLESDITFRNITFVQTDGCRSQVPGFIDIIGLFSTVQLVNNIFYSEDPTATIFTIGGANHVIMDPTYNLTYGMDNPWNERALGAGNLNVHPLLDPHDFANLRFDSPAINAGDPARTDPDGTRSDMGAKFFDHRVDHPPIITTSTVVETRWGEPFTFVITAIDEGPVWISPLAALPAWMHPRALDDTDNDTLFVETVPFGVSSFNLPIRANDAAGHTDFENIHVAIYPSSVLLDTVVGVLTTEYSPYSFHRDITVPPGDSLIIEPGVRVVPAASGCLPEIRVKGLLRAEGITADSIYFGLFADSSWNGINVVDSLSSLHADYCVFEGANQILGFNHSGVSEIAHSKLRPFRTSLPAIFVRNESDTVKVMSSAFITDNYSFQSSDSKFILDSCDFPHGAQLDHIICLRSSGLVTKNRFETAPVGIFVQDAGQVIVTHNVFQNCSFGLQFFDGPAGNTNALIYHNTFTDCGVSITLQDDNYPARIRGEIQNNIVVGSTSFAFRIGQNLNTDSVVLSNNCFWANAALTQEAQPRWIELGVLSQINLNGDSTDTYSNIYLTPEFSDTLLHLAEGSPCIDAGREVSLPFNGDAPDIGYWESNYGLAQQAIIGNLPQSHAWSIYPNPTNASVMIDLEALGTCKKVGLYNLLGQLVQKIDQTQILSRRVWLDLSSSKLSTGVYLVKVEGDTNEMVQKLIVLK